MLQARSRWVFIDQLDFIGAYSLFQQKERGYYRNWLRLEGPAELYTDEELEWLLRLQEFLNERHRKMFFNSHFGGFDSGCNFITFGKWVDDAGRAWMWNCSAASWHGDTTRPTLAEALSRFYRAYVQADMWGCQKDFKPHLVLENDQNEPDIRLQGVAERVPKDIFVLCAPDFAALNDMIDLYRQERDAVGKGYFSTHPLRELPRQTP